MADDDHNEASGRPGDAVGLLRRSAFAGLAIFVLCAVGAILVPSTRSMPWMTSRLVFMQDLWLGLGLLAVAVAALLAAERRVRPIVLERRGVWLVMLMVLLVTYAGRYFVLENYDLVRDEQLVLFDAWIYGNGRIVWPIPDQWRPHAQALNLVFMHSGTQPLAWVSSYLPGNALLHAAVGTVADPVLTNPLLAAGCAALLWSCARKLWPDDREAGTVSLLVLVLSGQFLISAMSTWAMTAHLFFNLLWLRLFVCDRRGTDVAAIACGAFATGLHQPLFHPMFVAPFLLLLLVERRWIRLLMFAVPYIAIGLFWLSWPALIEPLVTGPARMAASVASNPGLADRVTSILAGNTDNLTLTAANLLRYITWGHLASVPLMLAAWPTVRRGGLPLALATGLVLPIVVIAILLPWQGYGFGYRYLHPALGNVALLAGSGWRNLLVLHVKLRAPMLVASAGMLFAMVPMEAIFANRFAKANIIANEKIIKSKVDFVMIDLSDGLGYANIVYNSPDLTNRPIRLLAQFVENHESLAKIMCRNGSSLGIPENSFFANGFSYYGVLPFNTADATLTKLRVPYEAAGCRIVVLR